MKSHQLFYVFLAFQIFDLFFVDGTISPSDKGKKSKAVKELKVKSGPIDQSVFERNLIEDEPFAKDILVESGAYYRNTTARRFDGSVLGYVTPVNFNFVDFIL